MAVQLEVVFFETLSWLGVFVLIGGGGVRWSWFAWYDTYVEKLNKYYISRVLRSAVGRIFN